jgi:fermentation-respiration switch protein FrsA (DUF1100 family)
MIKIIGGAVGVYLLMLAAMYLFQRSLIYVPDRTRPEPSQFGVPEMIPVTLETDDGLAILAWWRPPAGAGAPTMVYFHGNAGHIGNRGDKVRPYLDQGWGVLLTTWRGYSGNPGQPTEQGLYADGRAALTFLAKAGITPARTVLYGESIGSGPAVELATGFAAGALILEAPFTSLPDAGARHYPIFPVRLLARDRYDSLAKIASVRSPLLVVHGGRDRVVPQVLGRRLLEAANEPKTGLFPAAAGHNDLYEFGAARAVIAFVKQHIDE